MMTLEICPNEWRLEDRSFVQADPGRLEVVWTNPVTGSDLDIGLIFPESDRWYGMVHDDESYEGTGHGSPTEALVAIQRRWLELRSYCSGCGEAVSDDDRVKADEVDQVYPVCGACR